MESFVLGTPSKVRYQGVIGVTYIPSFVNFFNSYRVSTLSSGHKRACSALMTHYTVCPTWLEVVHGVTLGVDLDTPEDILRPEYPGKHVIRVKSPGIDDADIRDEKGSTDHAMRP